MVRLSKTSIVITTKFCCEALRKLAFSLDLPVFFSTQQSYKEKKSSVEVAHVPICASTIAGNRPECIAATGNLVFWGWSCDHTHILTCSQTSWSVSYIYAPIWTENMFTSVLCWFVEMHFEKKDGRQLTEITVAKEDTLTLTYQHAWILLWGAASEETRAAFT